MRFRQLHRSKAAFPVWFKALPLCYKDPRFSYTLPAWLPCLHDTRRICIFREPGLTAESIVTECRTMPYLANLEMNVAGTMLDFHLGHGVDFIIATDNGSRDATRSILKR